MQWFYASNSQQIGPVADEDFKALVRDGTVGPDTLVWREGMDNWIAYRMVATGAPGFIRPKAQLRMATPAAVQCSQCGQQAAAADAVQRDGATLCPACAGTDADSQAFMRFGGFWIRFAAKLIDGIILGVIMTAIAFGGMTALVGGMAMQKPAAAIGSYLLLNLAMLVLQVVYSTFFVGKFGGTPGKLAVGLRIVRPDGSRVTYGRAMGRFFAEIVSGLILDIGYLMAAFDAEKRSLHDRMCDTRVVYKS